MAWFLVVSAIFGTAYTMRPLYSSNQNHHFLKGLADAGVGFLSDDWQVTTADPFPVFSAVVAFTHRYLSDNLFYLCYYLLFGAYILAVLRVGATGMRDGRSRTEQVVVFSLLTLLHNEVFAYLVLFDKAHIGWWQMTHWGVAGQEIFGHGAFQASSFGMLLPLAVLLFIRGRPIAAAVLAAVVADVHFSYALTSGSLVAAFVALTAWQSRQWRRAVIMSVLAAAIVTPMLWYTLRNFGPTSPEASVQAFRILSDHLPFEAVPSRWLGATCVAQLGLVIVAMILARRTALLVVLAVPTAVGVLLTAVQVLTGNQTLGLIFPWRTSVLVVPVSTAIIASRGVGWLFERWSLDRGAARKVVVAVAVVNVFLGVTTGIVRMTSEFALHYDYGPLERVVRWVAPAPIYADFVQELRPDSVPVLRYVERTRAKGDLYLIPPDLQRFRTYGGAPAFVDYKSHPYKDVEVIEWDRRLHLAQRFYAGQNDCTALEFITAHYRISHVVLDRRVSQTVCAGLAPVFVDDSYGVYRIVPAQ
ncbi:MAG TPA: DUF6798 domain-containing protein [Vicinamibacterales bacterium]